MTFSVVLMFGLIDPPVDAGVRDMSEGKAAEQSVVTDVKCPLCKKGFMAATQGRYGLYYTCNAEGTPKCRFNLSAKPTGRICTYKRGATPDATCGALMVEGTKTIPERCSDKACPNRNPHKL